MFKSCSINNTKKDIDIVCYVRIFLTNVKSTCTILTCFSKIAFFAFSASTKGFEKTEFLDEDPSKSGVGSFINGDSILLKKNKSI